MQQAEVLAVIGDIIRDMADDDTLDITAATTAQDVDDWDSMFHVRLMIELERKFSIRFETSKINAAKNVGELAGQVIEKLAA